MNIQHSSILSCCSCSQGHGGWVLEPVPAVLGRKQPDTLHGVTKATLQDKERFTPPDNGSGLVCGRDTCGGPTQIHGEQVKPHTARPRHCKSNPQHICCLSVPEMGGLAKSNRVQLQTTR